MPYINQPDDEELKKQQEAQAGAPTSISGQSAVLSTDAPSNKGGAKASGSYTNLNQYLDANKENAAQLGTGVASNITNQGEAARTGIQSTETDFNRLADEGTLKGLDQAPYEADSIVNQARTSNKASQIGSNQLSRFGEIANATYKGPNDLTGSSLYGDTSQKYQKAQEAKANAGSEQGRFSLLKDAYARPTYSQGQLNLDNLLLSGNDQAKATVSNAASGLSDLEGKWTGAQSNAANLAAKRQADTNAARTGAQQGLLSGRTARSSEVDSDLAAKQSSWADEYNQYNQLLGDFQGGDLNLTREQADRLALKDSGQGLYNVLNGVSPSQYLDLQAFDANKVVDQDQFAQLKALDQLALQFGNPTTSRFSDESLAGTLDAKKAFDASRFGAAASNADTSFQNYASGANVAGSGANDQSWYNGLGGTNKHWENARTDMDANLLDYLTTGNFNIDGRSITTGQNDGITVGTPNQGIPEAKGPGVGEEPGFAAGGGAPGAAPKDPLSSLVGSGVSFINDAIFGNMFGGGGKQEEARRAAKEVSAQQANQSFMANLNNMLGQQGYNNRVRIK